MRGVNVTVLGLDATQFDNSDLNSRVLFHGLSI